ncbi:MAG: hypothetical protein ABIP30_10060 [Ferruginibacter sp.]
MKQILVSFALLFFIACNNSQTDKAVNTKTSDDQFVTAVIAGKNWKSIPNEILATYSEIDDKLQIFTKDADAKTNVLLSLAPFSKTGVGNYNSVKEGAGGYGISLLDDNTADNETWDYDNFHQGAVPNCITITDIKETPEGKMIKGTYKAQLNESNNYDAAKSKPITIDGAFAVMLKK